MKDMPDYWKAYFEISGCSYYLDVDFMKLQINGATINVYQLGKHNTKTVFLLMPFGTSFLLMQKFAAELSKYFRVISWDTRNCLDHFEGFSEIDLEIETHFKDFMEIKKYFKIDNLSLVGWSSSTFLGTYISKNLQAEVVDSLILIAPWGISQENHSSKFEDLIIPKYVEISTNNSVSHLPLMNFLKNSHLYLNVKGIDKEISIISNLHSHHEMSFKIFTKHIKYLHENKSALTDLFNASAIKNRVHLIHAKDDDYVNVQGSMDAKNILAHITLHIFESGGHYIPYKLPRQIADHVIDRIIKTSKC